MITTLKGSNVMKILWKIDEAKDLDLAVIEDTEDGIGVCELGERTPRNIAIAKEIVRLHNKEVRQSKKKEAKL
jgi:hypothetical protein